MAEQSRGWQGTVLKALGAPDFELTVTASEQIGPHYLRLSFAGGGLLRERSVHPTMWIRLWFFNGKRLHQRAYTVLNADTAADTFDLDFSLHEGPAPAWARAARPGDTITATVMGSKFALPEQAPGGYLVVGDTASLPAINTLLGAIDGVPARVWLEWQRPEDQELPVAATGKTEITWVPREDGGRALVRAVESAAFDAADHFGWVACDMHTTRAVVKVLRSAYHVDRKSVKSQAYWV